MQTSALRSPAVPFALAVTLLTAFLVLFAPLSASAHDALVSSSPESGGTVDTLPAELTLTFSAKLISGEGATEVVVTDPDGNSVIDGPAVVDGAIVTQPLTSGGGAGEYHVIWKVVSSDGHPTSDEYFFTVATGTEATPTPTASAPSTAAPSQNETATPEATSTPAPTATSSASAWLWALSIGGIAVIAALMVWYSVRARKNGTTTDSDPSSER